jgi:hypothetical protein
VLHPHIRNRPRYLHRCRAFEMLYRGQDHENSALAFLYCDHVSREQQTPSSLMGALLGQLINRLSSDNPIIEELVRCRSEGKHLDLNTMVDYIRRISASQPATRIRLGADGLDELLKDHRITFLKSLGTLFTESNIHFLFFGRDHAGIQAELDHSFGTTSFTWYNITGESTTNDRLLFLQNCLDSSNNWSSLDHSMRKEIFSRLMGPESTLVTLSGVFTELIATCYRFFLTNLQIKKILDQPTKRRLVEAVLSIKLPPSESSALHRVDSAYFANNDADSRNPRAETTSQSKTPPSTNEPGAFRTSETTAESRNPTSANYSSHTTEEPGAHRAKDTSESRSHTHTNHDFRYSGSEASAGTSNSAPPTNSFLPQTTQHVSNNQICTSLYIILLLKLTLPSLPHCVDSHGDINIEATSGFINLKLDYQFGGGGASFPAMAVIATGTSVLTVVRELHASARVSDLY